MPHSTIPISKLGSLPKKVQEAIKVAVNMCRSNPIFKGVEISDLENKITYRIHYDKKSKFIDLMTLNNPESFDAFIKKKEEDKGVKYPPDYILVNMLTKLYP